jgi:hypothetical protein
MDGFLVAQDLAVELGKLAFERLDVVFKLQRCVAGDDGQHDPEQGDGAQHLRSCLSPC